VCKENDTEIKKSESKTIYDQRQTGKYNVHVNIKDVQFFSLSDSLGNIGDYASYDYSDYAGGDDDYDISHLTVNPIIASLGSKPTKAPTTTATTKTTSAASTTTSTTERVLSETSSVKQELEETTVKQQSVIESKPALKESTSPLKVNETIDYEEIPVEVQYYRNNQMKLPANKNRHTAAAASLRKKFRPAVQIIDGRANNVQVIENDQAVKICGRGEFRDNLGRCRVKYQRQHSHGL
jgi:hypothetical protein